MELDAKIESLLFYKGEPMKIKKIAEILDSNEESVLEAVNKLKESKENTGLCIIINNDEIELGTSKEASVFLEKLRKDELTKDLSKAALETLSIILYKNGVTRSEIDYIRGVNSSFILRNMLIRGLVEKEASPTDNRRILYKPTLQTLEFMGVTKIEELPKYSEVIEELNKVINNQTKENE